MRGHGLGHLGAGGVLGVGIVQLIFSESVRDGHAHEGGDVLLDKTFLDHDHCDSEITKLSWKVSHNGEFVHNFH